MNKKRLLTLMGGTTPKYILRDDFIGTVAAGSVHGSLATPGGKYGTVGQNTRYVVDTENKISIADVLVVDGQKTVAAYGDPSLRYTDVISRVAGRTIIFAARFSSLASKDYMIGVGSTANPIRTHGFFLAGSAGQLTIYDNNGADATVLASNVIPYTEFLFAIMLRSNGASYLVRGGQSFLTWTLAKTVTLNSDATMYVRVCGKDAVAEVSTVRVTDDILPATIDAGNLNILNKYVKPFSTKNIFALGDSRTVSPGKWVTLLSRYSNGYEFLEKPTRLAGAGWVVADLESRIDATLAAAADMPDVVWIDIGINDNGVTAEAPFKASLLYVLDAIHTKWASVPIYVDNVDKEEVDTTDINAWINAVIAARSTFTYLGTDEADYLPGNTSDGVHFTPEGYYLKASAILTRLGYTP